MNGTYQQHFPMVVDETYSNWFTPASGFTITSSFLRQVDQNLYLIGLTGEFSADVITAHSQTKIGSLNLSYFGGKPLAGNIPAVVVKTNDSSYYSAIVAVFSSGDVFVRGAESNAYQVLFTGLLVRREA